MDQTRHLDFIRFVEIILLYKLRFYARFVENVRKCFRTIDITNLGFMNLESFENFLAIFDEKKQFDHVEITAKLLSLGKDRIHFSDTILIFSSKFLRTEDADIALIETKNHELEKKMEPRKSKRN